MTLEWVRTHLPCPMCGSSDAYSINNMGWGKCFSCGRNKKENNDTDTVGESTTQISTKEKERRQSMNNDMVPFGEYRGLTKRGITEETCKKFGYFIGEVNNRMVQVASYYDDSRQLVAQKIRFPDKSFRTRGDFKNVPLFGQHLWPSGGKRLVITEGEIDAMTVSQLQGNKWPVVSVPTGAQSAASAIKRNLEYVISFESVVIMFDNDEPGLAATQEVIELLPVGKAKVATLPLKDPNEMLVAGRGEEVIKALWDAKEYRPDGIVDIEDILEDIEKPIELGLPWFLDSLTKITYGRRYGEIYGFGAGTGVGKTDWFTQQMAYDITTLDQQVGIIYLEQKPVETGKRIAGKIDGQRYHIPDAGWSQEKLKETLQSLTGKVTFYDSWGGCEWDVVKSKIRFMVVSKGIKLIYLDHLTALAETGNEKDSLEQIMKEMAGLANELNCVIHFVSHLSTPEGKPHEEGGRVMIKHFKGSRAIGFWSYYMFGMERNQQAESLEEQQTTTFRVLKDRYTGQATGKVIFLGYDPITGLLYEKANGVPTADAYGFTGGDTQETTTENDDF